MLEIENREEIERHQRGVKWILPKEIQTIRYSPKPTTTWLDLFSAAFVVCAHRAHTLNELQKWRFITCIPLQDVGSEDLVQKILSLQA